MTDELKVGDRVITTEDIIINSKTLAWRRGARGTVVCVDDGYSPGIEFDDETVTGKGGWGLNGHCKSDRGRFVPYHQLKKLIEEDKIPLNDINPWNM